MNRAKIESFTKFKKCLFLVVFLLSLNNISGQSSENCMSHMTYKLKCNKYNALYYDRENELTVNYDTARYPGDIVLNFDTAFFKNVVRVNKFKYKLSIISIDIGIKNPKYDYSIKAYYIEKHKKFKLTSKELLFIDTNTWHANLICDDFYIYENRVPGPKFMDFLQERLIKKEDKGLIYIVKNDQIVTEYKQINYCVSAVREFSNDNKKLCNYLGSDPHEGIFDFLLYINDWNPVYVENIEVIDLKGKIIYFPPKSFYLLHYWP